MSQLYTAQLQLADYLLAPVHHKNAKNISKFPITKSISQTSLTAAARRRSSPCRRRSSPYAVDSKKKQATTSYNSNLEESSNHRNKQQ